MNILSISGPDGSGKSTVTQALAAYLGLPIIPRLFDKDKAAIDFMRVNRAPLTDVADRYLTGMMRVHDAYKDDPQLYLADRWVVDLLGMMEAHHQLNDGPKVNFDLGQLDKPKAVIFLDCAATMREKRIRDSRWPLSDMDTLSLQPGCQDIFKARTFDMLGRLGLSPHHILDIDGTHLSRQETLDHAKQFLATIGVHPKTQPVPALSAGSIFQPFL